MNEWRELARLGARQHAVVTLGQAVGLGLDPRTVRRHAATRGWTRMHPGVWALPGSPRIYERDVAAALLAAGPRSVASQHTASRLLGLTKVNPRPVQLWVPADRAAPRLAGVEARRTKTLLTADVVEWGFLRHTAVSRTLCDLAGEVSEARLRELVARALQNRVTTLARIDGRLQRLGRPRGAGALRRVLDQLDGTSSGSQFERGVRGWLQANGLPPHPCLYPIVAEDGVPVELDIAYPDEMVYVDCRGFPFHSLPEVLVTDSVRANGVVAAGWLQLVLTQEQYACRDPRFLRQLRGLLEARRGFGGAWAAAHALDDAGRIVSW